MASPEDCALYYQRHRDERLAYQRAYYANPENRKKRSQYNKKYFSSLTAEEQEAEKQRKREGAFKRKYGISQTDYDVLFKQQQGICAICQKPERRGTYKGKNKLDVDHCHKTGKVRGLLCRQCNQALGSFGDDIDGVRRALEYISK